MLVLSTIDAGMIQHQIRMEFGPLIIPLRDFVRKMDLEDFNVLIIDIVEIQLISIFHYQRKI
jgi:hypothetical protein